MEELNLAVHSLEFKIAKKHIIDGKFDITQLEVVLDDIYDKTEDLDPELDIDISDRDMYIMSNKIEEVLPEIEKIMKKSGFFDMDSLELFEIKT